VREEEEGAKGMRRRNLKRIKKDEKREVKGNEG
jgi:hypothetical protein